MVNHHSETYAADDNIAGTDSKIALFENLSTILQLEFGNELWLKAGNCPHGNDDNVFKELFAEELPQSTCHIMRLNWSSDENSLLQRLPYHPMLLASLQYASRPMDLLHRYTNNRDNSGKCQLNRFRRTTDNIGSSSNP